jgi:hypothetical protein
MRYEINPHVSHRAQKPEYSCSASQNEPFFAMNWLQVLGTAERSQMHQRVRHQRHAIVPLLDAFKA